MRKYLPLGFCLAVLAVPPAAAGEAAEATANAEALVATAPAEAWDAFERATELFWAEAPLAFRTAVLVDGVDGFGQYQPRRGNSFAAGDVLTAYLEPVGYGWTPIGDDYRIRFTVDIAISTADGATVAREDAFAVIERTARTRSREFEATVKLTLPGLLPGGYVLSLIFHDAATGKSAAAAIPFVIEG